MSKCCEPKFSFFPMFLVFYQLKSVPKNPMFLHVLGTGLGNTVGKGEIARYKQFLFFPAVFSTLLENFPPFPSNLKLSFAVFDFGRV